MNVLPIPAAIMVVCLLWLPGLLRAEAILPVAEGRFSVAVVLDATTARPATGAWVEFIGKGETGIPERIGAVGFVLGTRNDVVFVELTELEAERVALARSSGAMRFQQIAAPDPEAVSERQRFRDIGQAVTLAPRLRTITVTVKSADDELTSREPGEVVIFPDLSEVTNRPSVTGNRAWTRNIEAMFVSATKIGSSLFDVTVVAEPRDAFTLLQTAARTELMITAPQGNRVRPVPEPKCFIRHRRGENVVSIEIPCRK